MYRCELTGVVIPPNTRCHRIVIESRPMTYRERPEANAQRISGKKKPIFRDDPGGTGWETAREVRVSPEVYTQYADLLASGLEAEAAVQTLLTNLRRA